MNKKNEILLARIKKQVREIEALPTFVYNKQEWNSKYWMTPLYKNISNEGILI
jgi:hypothetical protein